MIIYVYQKNGETMHKVADTYGIISFTNLIEGFIDSYSAKFATLWFDHLLFEDYWNSPYMSVSGIKAQSFSEWVAAQLQSQGAQPDTITYIQDRWQGIFDVQQEYDLIFGPHDDLPTEIKNVIEETVEREVRQPLISEGAHPIDVGKESTAAIKNTTDMVYRAIFAPANFSIVSGQLTRKTLAAISTSLVRTPSNVAHIMLHSQVPDFSALSWEDVVDLSHHSHYDVFRTRMRELQDLRNVGAIEEAGRLCNDIFTNSLKKLVQTKRTSSNAWNVVKGIIGNMTLLGWLFLGKDVAQERIASRYGWVYFVLDLENAVNRKKV